MGLHIKKTIYIIFIFLFYNITFAECTYTCEQNEGKLTYIYEQGTVIHTFDHSDPFSKWEVRKFPYDGKEYLVFGQGGIIEHKPPNKQKFLNKLLSDIVDESLEITKIDFLIEKLQALKKSKEAKGP